MEETKKLLAKLMWESWIGWQGYLEAYDNGFRAITS